MTDKGFFVAALLRMTEDKGILLPLSGIRMTRKIKKPVIVITGFGFV